MGVKVIPHAKCRAPLLATASRKSQLSAYPGGQQNGRGMGGTPQWGWGQLVRSDMPNIWPPDHLGRSDVRSSAPPAPGTIKLCPTLWFSLFLPWSLLSHSLCPCLRSNTLSVLVITLTHSLPWLSLSHSLCLSRRSHFLPLSRHFGSRF